MHRLGAVATLVFGVFMLLAVPALADNGHGNNNNQGDDNQGDNGQGHRPKLPTSRSAPEIDPVAAGAVVALLVGGTTVIAARRARRKSADK